MAHLPGWRVDLSFSDRFAQIERIITSFQSTGDSFEHAEARVKGKDSEKKIYHSAISREAYHVACESVITTNGQHNPSNIVNEAAIDDIDGEAHSSPALTIGTYENATHHRDGLFSSVYMARIEIPAGEETITSAKNGELVALKITTPASMLPPHDSKREARILELASSQHVITLIDAFAYAGGRFVLVFPFMPYDLERLLKGSRLDHEQTRSHLRNMFEALAFLHAAGIIHRDIKPSNVLLKSLDGPAYLADFGVSWAPGTGSSEASEEKITDVGTTSYRPPELLFGNTSYGCNLDLWAAGCVVAEAASLSNRTVFDSGDLGSELSLIQSIFKSLGTPNLEVWPEAVGFRDWGKMRFYEYPPKPWSELLPRAPPAAQDLVEKLLVYESGNRLSAVRALQHPYFRD